MKDLKQLRALLLSERDGVRAAGFTTLSSTFTFRSPVPENGERLA
jgi:hypothetical protein